MSQNMGPIPQVDCVEKVTQTQHQLNQSRMKQARTSTATNLSQILGTSNLNTINKTVSRSSLHKQDHIQMSQEIQTGGTGEQNLNLFGSKNGLENGKKKLQTHFIKSQTIQNQKDKYYSNSHLFIHQIYDPKNNKKLANQKQNS